MRWITRGLFYLSLVIKVCIILAFVVFLTSFFFFIDFWGGGRNSSSSVDLNFGLDNRAQMI